MTPDRLPDAPVKIRRALLSVSDKSGLIDLARALPMWSRDVETPLAAGNCVGLTLGSQGVSVVPAAA